MNSACILTPTINGEASTLYKDIKEKTKAIPTANFIYTCYLQLGVASDMDAKGYKRNKQGQHHYKDVYEYLGLKDFFKEQNLSIEADGLQLGTRGKDLSYIGFSNVEDAYRLASDYNSNHSGRLAYVVQNGDVFNVIIENKDSLTIQNLKNFKQQVAVWDVFKDRLNSAGLNADNVIAFIGNDLNPITVLSYLNQLNIFRSASNDLMSVGIIKAFLKLGENTPGVQALLNRGWGTIDEVAQRCYDALQNPSSVSTSTLQLINNTLDTTKNRAKFDVFNVLQYIKNVTLVSFNTTSDEKLIVDKLRDLEKQHQISPNIIERKEREIKTLTDAASEAIITLTREIRAIETEKGVTATVKKLEKTKELIADELASKRTYFGICKFLEQALDYANKIHDILTNVPTGNSKEEYIRNCAQALSKATNFRDGYYHIVEALSNMDNLIISENLSQADKDLLQTKAKEVKVLLDNQERVIKVLRQDTVVANLEHELGDNPEFGRSYADITKMLEEDTSIVDYIGQLGKSSNELLAATGSLIRNAQFDRDEKLRRYSTRIGKATKILYDAGYNSEFMYDESGRIITEEGVDWDAYNQARSNAYSYYVNTLGYRGFVLKEALENWERLNTIDKVVDPSTGRTERIPNDMYRLPDNPFDRLSAEQKAYYKEVMAIKGELGTLLPKYAQKMYLPPQMRASTIDLLRDAIKKKLPASKVAKILLDRMAFWKVREDDTDFITASTQSGYDNTPLKDIPIFYLTPLHNQDELLHDFSAALQSFAATALNYEAMSNIRETVETIQELVSELDVAAPTNKGTASDVIPFWDTINKRLLKLLVKLRKKSEQSRTSAILDAWVEKQLYNEQYKGNKKLNKIVNAMIGYNSVVRLSANVLGAYANITAGDIQMFIEAGGGEFYNVGNLLKAHGLIFGKTGAIWDVLTGNKENELTLLFEFFDVTQDTYSDAKRKRYYQNPFRRLFGGFNSMFMYSGGEFLIRGVNGLAVLDHEKVLLNGKAIPIRKAFTKTVSPEGYPELQVKDNVTTLDGEPLDVNHPFFKEIKKKVKASSDECFGAMSTEDKGVITQHFLGRMTMNFRQWMVEHYSRRYRRKHWDSNRGKYVEGYYITVFRLGWQLMKGFNDFTTTWEVMKDQMTEQDVINCRKALSEFIIFMALNALSFCIGGEDDHEDEFWARFFIYNIKRMQRETLAAMPFGILAEAKRTINSPIPLITTFNGLLYPITGIMDVTEIIDQGRYEGWNKYARNVLWYTVPYYKQIDQMLHLGEEDALFTIFDNKL